MDMPARPVFEHLAAHGHAHARRTRGLRPPRRWPATIATPASHLVLFGSTGEGNLLSLPEIDMIEAIRTDPRALPLVFGAGGVDRGVAAAIRRLDKLSPAGYLVPPPHLCPSQQGILCTTARSPGPPERPVILYNIPSARALR